jgi:hypothetical protein
MKTTLLSSTLGLMLATSLQVQAQRYATEIFSASEISTESNVAYGVNVNPLFSADYFGYTSPADDAAIADWNADMGFLNDLLTNGEDIPQNFFFPNQALPPEQQTDVKLAPLTMDIYTPPGTDDVSDRPLIIFIHTGNFLPALFNGGITGDKVDSAGVNLCKQWAQRGFVAASINYRLGWNPLTTDLDVRRGGLLRAVYRALHDTQTAVRFFRASVEGGNVYGIDPSKIVLFGQGSGGYVSQAYATLDNYGEEIAGLSKFVGNQGPYVLEARDGNIDGGPGITRLPDPLQLAGIPKDVQMTVNAGGALADLSWLEDGDTPMVSIHCVRDPFAPFNEGTVIVPTTNGQVVDVSGSNQFIQQANDFGNNDVFANIPDGDPFTDRARSLYGETFDYILPSEPTVTINSTPEGLFPVVLDEIELGQGDPFFNQAGPWDWWDFGTLQAVVSATNSQLPPEDQFDAAALNAQGLLGNPGMSPEKGLAYIDTIQGYTVPRIILALDLPLSVENELVYENSTSVYPNPTQGELTIRNDEFTIRRVELMDITGRVVMNKVVNSGIYTMNRNDFSNGVYLMRVVFDDNQITKKVLFN